MADIIGMEYFGKRWGYYKLFHIEGRIDRDKATFWEVLGWKLLRRSVKNDSNEYIPGMI